MLSMADVLVGHNIINFDFRALKKVYKNFKLKKNCKINDTLIVSRVLWPELEPVDEANFLTYLLNTKANTVLEHGERD